MVKKPPAVPETWVQSLSWEDTLEKGTGTHSVPETWVQSLSWEDTLEKGTGTHSSILAWKILKLYSPWGHEEAHVTE